MNDIITLYRIYNRSGAQNYYNRLILLARAKGIQGTLKENKQFLASRSEEQQLKGSKITKQSHGYIPSYNPFDRLNSDIFVLKQYESSNNGYAHLLCIILKFQKKLQKLSKNYIL
jgi:hypothetical protein